MTGLERPRLAPWRGEDGKPCFLVTSDHGFLGRLADDMEDELLTMGGDLLAFSNTLLEEDDARVGELRFLARRLNEALRDALLVAECRGERLPSAECRADHARWSQRHTEEVVP